MDSNFGEKSTAKKSSAVSSEASSQSSISSGYDYETEVINKASVLKQKSSSLSCLPDHVTDFDLTSLTLPTNLSSVKPFGENLLREGALSARSRYETAEGEEELDVSSNEDQRSAFELNNSQVDEVDDLDETNNMVNGMDPKEKRAVNLSELNTDTQTYVRSSALDILAKFPKTETVSPMEGGDKNLTLNEVKEDVMEGRDECPDGAQMCSKSVNYLSGSKQSEQNNITSWSSTSDFKKKHEKKGLFSNDKKVKDIVTNSPESNSTENSAILKAKKVKKHVRKDKPKSPQSIGFFSIFRGKNTVTDERPTKQKKPLQKSQSFNASLPRSPQFNRMDSFRRLFKRPRDSAASPQSKPIDNVRCMEISSPILKSNFKSKNLVDREVFLRERAYQIDKTKVKQDKTKREPGVVTNVKASNNSKLDETTSDEKSWDMISNDNKDESSIVGNGPVNTQESPIPPVRHKHIQRKQRLSMQGSDDLLHEGCSKDNDSNKEYELVKSDSKETREFQDQNEIANKNESNPECKNEIKHESDEQGHDLNLANKTESTLNQSTSDHEKTCDNFNAGHSQVAESIHNDGLQTVAPDDNDNLDYVILRNAANDSDVPITPNASSPDFGGPTSILISPSGTRGQSDSEFEEVFVDCISDENISLDSATQFEEKPQLVSEDTSTDGCSMPTGRWKSDVVTSRESRRAIKTAMQKKPASFSGVSPTSSGEIQRGNSMANGIRSPTMQMRRSSTFKVPSFRFEPSSEPISLITDVVPVTFPNFLTDRRSQIVLELFTTERTYVRGLETMIELFKMPMLAGRMDEADVDAVFSNLNDIFNINKDLLFLLWEKVKHWNTAQCIAHIFIEMEDRFKIYATFCKNFDNADAVLKQKIKKNKEFDRFLKACYQDPLCQPGLDLPAYLITIVQRIPRYLLLLKDLYKKTPSSHADYYTLQTALSRMNKVAEYINSQLQEVHGKKAMQELRSTVIGLKAYEVKGRTLLKEGEVCVMSPKKPYKCLLFNDIMVFAVQGPKDRSEIEMTLELRTLWFEDLKKQDPQTSKCDAIELYTPHRPYTLYACSRTEKRVWLQKLRTAIVTLLYGPDCEDPDAMDIGKRKTSDTYFDGSVYCGEYVNGKRHGQGVMAWPNRTRYEGSWADDERHGHGQLTYYTGEKYVGNWVADKKEGEGHQTYVNNDVYNGQWKEGKMHGKGEIKFANGDCYVGEMFNNEVEGYGELTCSSKLIYKGDWKRSKRHGKGHLFLPNGNEYKGEMLNDHICGSGTMKYFNGDEYTGEWVNALRHGSGCFKLVNGTVYDGQWNNDCMNGEGEMSYPNGNVYSGTWYQNKRVGKGQLMYAHGDTYNGQWQNDTMHGKGVMYYKDGSYYEGEWVQGQTCGHGKTVYGDKRVYEGEYHNGFRHGRGQLIYPNNVLYVGEWKNDKFDGNGVFNDPNTDYSYTGDWSCGMREGSGVEISYRTRYEGKWKADMKHGEGVEKTHAGHVFVGTWKENRKHGKGTRTLRSKIVEIQHWHEGHLIDGGQTVVEELPPLPRR